MKTESHLKLGIYLSNLFLPRLPAMYRTAFVAGNIIPDFDPFSYLKGWHVRPFFGHNWENCADYITRTAGRLETEGVKTAVDCYLLGRLAHYLCDAFTFVHNSGFTGSLRQHNAYEKRLHDVLAGQFDRPLKNLPSGSLAPAINRLHEEYLRGDCSPERDAEYILSVSAYTIDRVFAPTAVIRPAKRRELSKP